MNKSIWSEYKQKPNFGELQADTECDILIIGGGMAGILTAHFLSQSGKNVLLVEAKCIGDGITKNTTAVITAQHDTLYCELLKKLGGDSVKAYLSANLDAVEEFHNLAKNIDCDYKVTPSYLYSQSQDLKGEQDALLQLGYKAEITTASTLPFPIKSAVKFPDMAEFHPLKFLYAIAKDMPILENTMITEIKDNTAFTAQHKITFKKAIIATHFPFIDRRGLFFVKMYQERSYVIALENAGQLDGTYVDDLKGGFYWRNYKDYLLIGKGDHRTGTKTNAFGELEDFAKQYYPNATIKYKWSNQDCITLDALPYVGKYGNLKDVYTLSGFNFWGMTGSMVGAKLLTDLLNGTPSKYSVAFATDRSMLRTQLFKNLGEVLLNMIKPTSKRCPHLGCALTYNAKEHSWDCPCHGSRFDKHGKLIDNPATKDAKL